MKEWKNPSGRKEKGATTEAVVNKLPTDEYAVLGRIGMRYLPGSSLLKSPTGHQVIEQLHAQNHLLGDIQKAWMENMHTLLQVCNATEFKTEMIETLAKAYLALDKEADADMRAEINVLLLKLVAQKPKALGFALWAFVNSVYVTNQNLFLRDFMPGLIEDLIQLEKTTESGAVAEVFVLFCIDGCALEGKGGNLRDRCSTELDGWLGRFNKGLTASSIKRLNQSARKWKESSREHWYQVSGYKERWWQTRSAKIVLAFTLLVTLLVALLFGMIGYKIYPWLKNITHGDKEANQLKATNTSTMNPQKSNPGKEVK